MRSRASIAALALAFVGASVSGARAAEPGVVLPAPTALQIGDIRTLGVQWVRVFLTWPDLEPQRGVFAANWLAKYERLFAALPAGTKVIIDVVEAPKWETGSSNPHAAPANPADYAAFLGTLAGRWAGRVSAYEIWNEEDSASWWAGGPDPVAYTQLLQDTYPVVKVADPNATVVLGGLTGNDYPFLEGVYRAGGKGYFDAVGVHTDTACNVLSPYDFLRGQGNRMIPDSFLAYREVHATMLANGDDKPIWMTETSWRTTRAVCPEGVFAGHKPEGVTPGAGPLPQTGLPLPRPGPLRSGCLVVSVARRRQASVRPDTCQRRSQALVCRHALVHAKRRSASRTVRSVRRPQDQRALAGERRPLFRPASDPCLCHQSRGGVSHHAQDRRSADPQLRRPALPQNAFRQDQLAGREAHLLRQAHPYLHRLRQRAQRLRTEHHDQPSPAGKEKAPAWSLARRSWRIRSSFVTGGRTLDRSCEHGSHPTAAGAAATLLRLCTCFAVAWTA